MNEEYERLESRFRMRLTKSNWHSEFRERFLLFAITFGEAGAILMSGGQLELTPPVRFMRSPAVPLEANGSHRRDPVTRDFLVSARDVPWYPDTERGDRQYDKYEKRFETLMSGKKKLLSVLMMSMEPEVYDMVATTEHYDRALQEFDIYTIWRMTEQAVTGNVATSVYALVMRLFKLKQEGLLFAKYDKDFKTTVRELQSRGTAEEREARYFNALYVMGANQEQFKDRLSVIYGTRDWPNYADLSAQFHQYAEAHARMSELRGEKVDTIAANSAKAGGGQGSRMCWNCLSSEHVARECDKPKHRCGNCGGWGHQERFCREGRRRGDEDRSEEPRRGTAAEKGTERRGVTGKDAVKKRSAKGRFMKKFLAQVATLADDDASLYDEDEAEDEDDEFDNVGGNMVTCDIGEWRRDTEDVDSSVVKALSSNQGNESLYVIDTGCRGAHVLQDDAILATRVNMAKRGRMPTVESASGHHMSTVDAGTIAAVDGIALVTPESGSNLLSLMEMVKYNEGNFTGDKNGITIKDGRGKVILRGCNRGDDLWTCTEKDLKEKISALAGNLQISEDETETEEENSEELPDVVQVQDLKTFLTTEEKLRAEEAFQLCAKLRHPGDQVIINVLNNSLIPGCVLSSRDFQNARKFIGRCPACAEGKMRADALPSSQAEPARVIGERVYVDLVPLSGKSIGGNTMMCIAIDEKSSYGMCIPIKSKQEKDLEYAGEVLLSAYNSRQHRLIQLCTDDEACLRLWGKRLGSRGVRISATPAGLHCKRVERYIQTIKTRRRAMLTGLYYELPTELEAESYVDVVYWSNALPNKSTGELTSPTRLFTGVAPFMPDIPFGTHGLFYNGREDKKRRSIWGIFLGYGEHKRYLRVFDPLTRTVRSCHKFEPMDTEVPAAWKLRPRLRSPDVQERPILRLPNIQTATDTPVSEGAKGPTAVVSEGGSVRQVTELNSHVNSSVPGPVDSEGDGSKGRELDEVIRVESPPETNHTGLTREEHTSSPVKARPRAKAEKPNPADAIAPVITTEGKVESAPTGTRSSLRQNRTSWKDGPMKTKEEPYKIRNSANNSKAFSAMVTTLAQMSRESSPEEKESRRQRDKMLKMIQEAPAEIEVPDDAYYTDLTAMRSARKAKAMKTSLRQALKDEDRRDSILASIFGEIDNLEQPGILTSVKFESIPKEMRKHIIGVYMFHKEKFKADGTFDKDKTRLVLLSNQREEETIGDTYCPTVNPISVMTQLNLAAVDKDTTISAYDIKGAFLLAKMVDQRMFMRVGPEVAKYWMKRVPERRKFLHTDGCLYFELNRYVYGLHEAPRAFNSLLDKSLQDMGLHPTKADACVYTKRWKQGTVIVSVHVDDMLVTTPEPEARRWFEEEIGRKFEIVTQRDEVSYLGMSIKREADGSVTVNQRGFLDTILKRTNCENLAKTPNTPAGSELLHCNQGAPAVDKKEYLSLIMSLMYLARFTRPDILFSVSFLASRCSNPTKDDKEKLMRIVRYLSGTRKLGLRFDGMAPFEPQIAADASHHLYESGHGQQSFIIYNGSAPVGSRSTKIRMVTRSSSESELVALEEASTYAVWYALLLRELGVSVTKPIPISQDNKSTILMAAMGPTFRRTKHLIGKRSFVRERLAEGKIILVYKPTKEMTADILTKPVDSSTFKRLIKNMGMREISM